MIITNRTFKKFFRSCFWEEYFWNTNFNESESDSDSEDYGMENFERSEDYEIDNYERGVASFIRTEELKISRGDTLALNRCTFCVVDEWVELERNDIHSLELSISPHFHEQYATWLKKYVELKYEIISTQQDVLY